jgi:hypothetical protein
MMLFQGKMMLGITRFQVRDKNERISLSLTFFETVLLIFFAMKNKEELDV